MRTTTGIKPFYRAALRAEDTRKRQTSYSFPLLPKTVQCHHRQRQYTQPKTQTLAFFLGISVIYTLLLRLYLHRCPPPPKRKIPVVKSIEPYLSSVLSCCIRNPPKTRGRGNQDFQVPFPPVSKPFSFSPILPRSTIIGPRV